MHAIHAIAREQVQELGKPFDLHFRAREIALGILTRAECAELQGRFPIRVELASLTVTDFEQILTNTDACLVRQYEALLATEGVKLDFRPEAIRRLAEIAWQVNEKTENIGARRLYTVMEKLLEEVSFEASKHTGETILIDAAYVDSRLKDLAQSEDLARYVL